MDFAANCLKRLKQLDLNNISVEREMEMNQVLFNKIILYMLYMDDLQTEAVEVPKKKAFMKAVDVIDRFKENFNPELNPGVDINQLYAGSRKKIWYPDRFGRIRYRSLYDIAHSKNQYRPQADNVCYGIIGDSASFWKYCTDEENKDNKEVLRTDMKRMFHMKCPECGKEFRITPKNFFIREEPCPFCARNKRKAPENRVFEGTVDLEDPFLRAYWADTNKISIDSIALTSPKKYNWECPLCGFTFKKAPLFMVKANPKCPMCRDAGMEEYLNISISETDVYMRKGIGVRSEDRNEDRN